MSDLDLSERAIEAMMARLQNGNSVIDSINAERAASNTNAVYPIPYPAQVLDSPPVRQMLNVFPTVAIIDGEIRFEDDQGFLATGLYEMTVAAYLQNSDPRALAWQLRRYAQWMASVLLVGRNMDGGGWGVVLKGVSPGARLQQSTPSGVQGYMSWISVTIEIKDDQSL